MNWLKQSPGKPLFESMLWDRPLNKRYAGKLLIIGGHQQSFNEVSTAYSAAVKAGAGTVRVLLPDSLQKMLSKVFPEAEYAASTPIGSFGRKALGELLELAAWSDGVLLAGDLGRNSETEILLHSFVQKYQEPLVLTGDSLDYFVNDSELLSARDGTVIVGNISQLQKLAQPKAVIKQQADLNQILNMLSIWTSGMEASIVTEHSENIIVCNKDNVSTTKVSGDKIGAELAAYGAVWSIQQPEKHFEALTTSMYSYSTK